MQKSTQILTRIQYPMKFGLHLIQLRCHKWEPYFNTKILCKTCLSYLKPYIRTSGADRGGTYFQ
ncbi:unnamed protein product [Acanthoscelides obtectus]|uniref:Uncharacterized protein n=1 Tax=Acanthoscelides obtectus TaxID=200917 RepID=A0A9P0KWT3_ACAOB|nr:unnamed protein product [Acanthoscelides obtectus]CAK1632845.1 hypothetical protein AOBTE_LOCUS7762 [Acanthoscelides obtectus]